MLSLRSQDVHARSSVSQRSPPCARKTDSPPPSNKEGRSELIPRRSGEYRSPFLAAFMTSRMSPGIETFATRVATGLWGQSLAAGSDNAAPLIGSRMWGIMLVLWESAMGIQILSW